MSGQPHGPGDGTVRVPRPLGWWAISGEAILDALQRVASGENPDAVFAELYANSEHESAT